MDQELRIARALTKAHTMEAILHGTGRWELALGTWGLSSNDLVALGRRVVDDTHVAIEADFPPHCWLGHRPTLLTLLYDGEVVGVREVKHPGDGSFAVAWSFSIQVVEQAA